MTPRERLWAVLNGREPDRVPIWMLFPREQYGSYVDVYNLPSYQRIARHVWDRTDWFDRRSIVAPPFYTAAAEIESQVQVRDGWTITTDKGYPYKHPLAGLLVDLEKQISQWLAQLGFNPTDRSRLGVAEVKPKGTLELLRERAQKAN